MLNNSDIAELAPLVKKLRNSPSQGIKPRKTMKTPKAPKAPKGKKFSARVKKEQSDSVPYGKIWKLATLAEFMRGK